MIYYIFTYLVKIVLYSLGEIWQSVTALDHAGMAYIEALDLAGFYKYLNDTENTICGRNPICVFMATVIALNKEIAITSKGTTPTVGGDAASKEKANPTDDNKQAGSESETKKDEGKQDALTMTFLHYTQSNNVTNARDTSVSYASSVCHSCSEKIKGITLTK